MTITAKFSSVCPVCHGAITPGSRVEWSKGEKARHVSCASSPTSGPARSNRAARPGKRTGCSCGSRVDAHGDLIPSRFNCTSCEHDA